MSNDLGGATEDHPEEHPGVAIRRAREALGLSQPELGERAGVGARTVRRVEAGEGNPEARTVASLRRALGLPVEGAPADPVAVLRTVGTIDFLAETNRRFLEAECVIADLTRKLEVAEEALRGQRVQLGELPSGVADKPGVLRGPDTGDQRAGSDD